MSNIIRLKNQELSFHLKIEYAHLLIQSVVLTPCKEPGIGWSFSADVPNEKLENAIVRWLTDYSQKREPGVLLPFNLDGLSPFTKNAMNVVMDIPFGKTLTYSEVATLAGSPKAARAVGSVCSRNPIPFFIPCHRVLKQGSRVGDYSAGGESMKMQLLAFEGVETGEKESRRKVGTIMA